MTFIIHIFDKEIDSNGRLIDKKRYYILIGFEGIINEPGDDTGFSSAGVTEKNDFILFFGTDTDSVTSMTDGFVMC